MLDRSPRQSRAAWVAVGMACVATGFLTACDTGDGRQLRPAGPDQTATLVNSTTTSAPPDPAVLGSGLPGEGVGEGGLTLRAPWEDEGVIDPRFTCQGTGTSPALSWSGVPAEATNLALVVTDLSADGFIHWIMVGIDPGLTGLEEGLAPTGAVQGTNSFDAIGWGGPCPPPGTGEHEYLVQLHALDQTLDVAEGFDAQAVLPDIEAASIGTVTLVGRFSSSEAAATTSTTVGPSSTLGPVVTPGPSPT